MKLSRKLSKLIQIWADPSVYKELNAISDRFGRSISDLVREGISNVILEYKDKPSPPKK